jgi:hypothetical protein
MGILGVIPFTVFPLIIYALFALPQGAGITDSLAAKAFGMPMPSGQEWTFTWGGLLLLFAIVCLFIDILKSTRPTRNAMIDNGLSIAVFILSFILFLLVKGFATTEFFLITSMTLLDFIAGSVIMVSTAQRSVQFDNQV